MAGFLIFLSWNQGSGRENPFQIPAEIQESSVMLGLWIFLSLNIRKVPSCQGSEYTFPKIQESSFFWILGDFFE